MAFGYVFVWIVTGAYLIYMWWKLIHQKFVPLDKEWAVKARTAAEAAGIPLIEIPGWALDKELRRAAIAESLERAASPALSSTGRRYAFGSFEERVVFTSSQISTSSDSSEIELHDDQPETDSTDDRFIDVEATSITLIVDEELSAYNRYLYELSQSSAPKGWRSQTNFRGVRRKAEGPTPKSEA